MTEEQTEWGPEGFVLEINRDAPHLKKCQEEVSKILTQRRMTKNKRYAMNYISSSNICFIFELSL